MLSGWLHVGVAVWLVGFRCLDSANAGGGELGAWLMHTSGRGIKGWDVEIWIRGAVYFLIVVFVVLVFGWDVVWWI